MSRFETGRLMRFCVVAISWAGGTFAYPVRAQSVKVAESSVRIRAAMIMPDLTVRPVPQMDFNVVSATGDTTRLTTNLDGEVTARLRMGSYTVVSAEPLTLNNSRYRWSVPLTVQPGSQSLELTQKNAIHLEDMPQPLAVERRQSSRRVTEEAEVYARVRRGVFTIYGQEGKGSGFLVDSGGLVLTNAHVMTGTDEARVEIDSVTTVRARILKIDKDRDVAVLAINMSRCTGCTVLPLANPGSREVAEIGERVLAVGSPLHQTGVLTTGIVSKVEARAIISDVNINHGNSGGPLLNLDGEVIAINTFGDMSDQGGPGVSGSILITQARSALADAKRAIAMSPPSDSLMPRLSKVAFPIEGLRAAALQRNFDLRPYVGEVNSFLVEVMTPPVMAWRNAQASKELLARRTKRESAAGVSGNEKIDPIQAWASWDEYVGERKPGVVIQVTPEVGQTTGSAWSNFFGALAAGYSHTYYEPHAILEFKADFRDMHLFRDGIEIIPVEKSRVPAVLNVRDYTRQGKDVANQGIYVFRPDDFAPNADGSFPKFSVSLINTANPQKPMAFDIGPKTVAAVWRDFAAHRVAVSVLGESSRF